MKYEKDRSERKTDWFECIFIPFIILALIAWLYFKNLVLGAVIFIVPVICAVLLYCQLRGRNKIKRAIRKGEFHVSTDTLERVTLEDIAEVHKNLKESYATREVAFLCFKSCKWRVPMHELYEWSVNYHLSPKGLCDTSCAGNTFYVAILDSNSDISCVYNTKFFEYREKTT